MPKRVFAWVTVLLLVLPSAARGDDLYSEERVIMGTYVTITASRDGMPEEKLRPAVDEAFGEVDRVDRLMSTYKPESQLSEVNRNAGVRPVKVDPEVVTVVKDALELARQTGGAFDPTVGPLVKLWGIGGKSKEKGGEVPGKGVIKDALGLVDYREVVVDPRASTVFVKKKGMSIDLGGIAKGYSADRAVDALRSHGVKGGIVAVAGELKLFGRRPDGKLWRIGLQHPREEGRLLAKLDATDIATSTSGDYERYFMKDGVRYHHVLDPKTGYPARGLISVTVMAKQSYLADGLATGLFVLGPSRAYEFAKAHPEIEVLMVTSEGRVLATGRLKELEIGSIEIDKQ